MTLMLPDASDPLWIRGSRRRHRPLDQHLEVDVAVVGAGIAGLTTAVLAAREGASVTVLEAERVGWGTSGRTTAKVSVLQGTRYRTIREHHGVDTARRYAIAQNAGLAWMRYEVAASGIDCDWEDQPAVTFATDDESRRLIDEELRCASEAGLDVRLEESDGSLPLPRHGMIVLDHQAQANPYPYLVALADEVASTPGCSVHEGTRVTAVSGRRIQRLTTDGGATVDAGHVVVATLLPIVDRGLFFARSEPVASHLLALRIRGEAPAGMFLSAGEPARSFRRVGGSDATMMLVGGNGHGVGRSAPTLRHVEGLLAWARSAFDVEEVLSRWMAHDYAPVDHLPWVGPAWPGSPNLLVAGGFEKWGMTGGTAAGLALADRIVGRADGPSADWADIFHPTRPALRSVGAALRLNATVAAELARGWIVPGPQAPGRAARRYRDGLLPSGIVDDAPTPSDGSVVCTHLGGVCSWNDAERTWDCPLHGSRFESDGTVLTGPATTPLHRHRLP